MSANSVEHCDHVDLLVLGTVVRVILEDPADREAVEEPWRLCLMSSEPREVPKSRLVSLPASSHDDATRRFALTRLTQSVTYAAIGEQSGRHVMFHAGGLANLRTGASVVYVAPGGTGKTTISATLGPGRGYITDETVAVTRSGEITPYPKPLSTRNADGGKDELAPGSLGLRPPAAAPWLAGLLALDRDPAHVGDPVVQTVGLLDAIALLSPETSALAALDEPLRTLRDIIEGAGGLLRVTYMEARQLGPLVEEILSRDNHGG